MAGETIELLKKERLFSDLDGGSLEALASRARRRSYSEGDVLFRSGDDACHVLVIVAGLVKSVRQLPSGEQAILGVLGPGDALGLAANLSRARHRADALALTAVDALCIRSDDTFRRMASRGPLAANVSHAFLGDLHLLTQKIEVLTAGDVAQRLACLFCSLMDRFAARAPDGTVVLPVALTRGDLSALIGARSETVIRVMSAWRRDAIVTTTPRGFAIGKLAELRRIRDGEPAGAPR